MLKRFFASSKPINIAVIVAGVLIFLFFYFISRWPNGGSGGFLFEKLGLLLCFLFSLGVLNFVAKKNTLTRKNSYIYYFFALFTLSLPNIFLRPEILIAGLFILLALRRIISLKSGTETSKKIFDGAFWILVASVFYFPSIVFLVLLYFAIVFYASGNYKHWMIPLVAVFTVLLLCITYSLYTIGLINFIMGYISYPTYDFTAYSQLKLLIPLSFFGAIYLWAIIKYIGLLSRAAQRLKPAYALVLIASILAVILAVSLAPAHDGSEFYFLFGPLAIISSRYVERGKSKWFSELLLWLTFLLPFIVFFFI